MWFPLNENALSNISVTLKFIKVKVAAIALWAEWRGNHKTPAARHFSYITRTMTKNKIKNTQIGEM